MTACQLIVVGGERNIPAVGTPYTALFVSYSDDQTVVLSSHSSPTCTKPSLPHQNATQTAALTIPSCHIVDMSILYMSIIYYVGIKLNNTCSR